MIIVVMGVTSCGKSTIGKLLAKRLSLPFIEGDESHPEENILKMSKGIPLNNDDRRPWLQILSHELQMHEKNKGAVLACSALKESYRKLLQEGLNEKIIWIYLEGTEEVIRKRMKERKNHFMPETLLQSQLSTLEKPSYAYSFSIEKKPDVIVEEIMDILKKTAENK
ncbi:MAG TPA: gluconokinase [Flavisolibacter sp.]|nr:gluconokinase [Flavisolibacter sp.]